MQSLINDYKTKNMYMRKWEKRGFRLGTDTN